MTEREQTLYFLLCNTLSALRHAVKTVNIARLDGSGTAVASDETPRVEPTLIE